MAGGLNDSEKESKIPFIKNGKKVEIVSGKEHGPFNFV
jgi:hypothetical protein